MLSLFVSLHCFELLRPLFSFWQHRLEQVTVPLQLAAEPAHHL